MIDDELPVQPHGRQLADLHDAERVPLAERPVGAHQRILAGGVGRVVPESAGSLVGALRPLAAGLRRVPDLHLWGAAEIHAAVGLGHRAVLQRQLDVAVLALRRRVGAAAIVHERPVFDAPVRAERLVVGLPLCLARPRGELCPLARIGVAETVPAGEIRPVEQGHEAGGCRFGSGRRGGERRWKPRGREEGKSSDLVNHESLQRKWERGCARTIPDAAVQGKAAPVSSTAIG